MIKEEQQDDFFSYKPESEIGLDASFGSDIMKIIESLGEDSSDQFDLLLRSKIGECDKSEVVVAHGIFFPATERNQIPGPVSLINQSNQLKRKSTSLVDRHNGHSEKKTKFRKQIALWDEFPNQKDGNFHFSWLKRCSIRVKCLSPDVAFKMYQKISLTETGEFMKASKSTLKADRDLKSMKRKEKEKKQTEKTKKLDKKNSKESKSEQKDRTKNPKNLSRNSLPKKVEQSKEKILANLKKESSKKSNEKKKVDSHPTVKIKPILKRTQSMEFKNVKKVSFCSKIFIRRFIPEDLEQS